MPLDNLYELIHEAENLWHGDTAPQQRHAFIRKLSQFYVEPNTHRIAQRMEVQLNRYCMNRWQFDREKPIVPDKYRGTKSEWMFKLLKANNGFPLSKSRIEEILSGRKCA